jgi:hypothetical protein
MRTLFLATAAFAALIAIAPIGKAHADTLVCDIQKGGDKLVYAFGPNTAGTYVEKSFRKNGTDVVSDVGQRPIWFFSDTATGRNITSRANPGWTISTFIKGATLTHNGRFAGTGSCEWEDDKWVDDKVNNARDQGQ